MNKDQVLRFTGSPWITPPAGAKARATMNGGGRHPDNIFIERLWRSLKQEAVRL